MPDDPNDLQELLRNVKDAWRTAAVPVEADEQTKKLFARGNLRLNAREVFAAAWHLTLACLKASAVATGAAADPMTVLEIGADAFFGISAAIDGFSHRLNAAEFLACVYLSQSANGIAASEFVDGFGQFLDKLADPQAPKLPWYLAVNQKTVQQARAFLEQLGADVLSGKSMTDLIQLKDGRYVYREVNFTWGFA